MRILTALLTLLLAFATSIRAGDPEPGFIDTLYVGGLILPVGTAFLPDGRMLIIEKAGAIKLFDGVNTTSLAAIPVCSDLEMGLLGIAIDPDFGSNGFIYLYRTEAAGGCGSATGRSNEVVRVTMGPGDTINLASLTVLLTGIRTDGGNHDGGGLRIGPDLKLYVGVGDAGLGDNQGGPGSSTNPYAQDLDELEGKMLRLNLDGTIPADNPYFGHAGKRGEIFASGLRNPFRFGFDPLSGGLWVGDVGDLTIEEIDIVGAGGNDAWPHCEGLLPSGCQLPGDDDPIFTYAHGELGGAGSIIGGAFAGVAFGPSAETYVFGDFNADRVYLAQPNGGRSGITGTPATIVTNAASPVDFVRGPDGAIYYTSIFVGEIRRLTAGPLQDQLLFGKKLDLKSDLNPTRRKLMVKAKDSLVAIGGPAGDPTLADSTIRFKGATFDATYTLPKEGWRIIGKPSALKGYRYKDADLVNGPIKTASIKVGKVIQANGKGAGLAAIDVASDPEPVDVVLSAGGASGQRYCLQFGGTIKFTASRQFQAKDADPPSACAP